MDHKFYHFSKWLYKEFSDTLVKIKQATDAQEDPDLLGAKSKMLDCHLGDLKAYRNDCVTALEVLNVLPKWDDLSEEAKSNIKGNEKPNALLLSLYVEIQNVAGIRRPVRLKNSTGIDATQEIELSKYNQELYKSYVSGFNALSNFPWAVTANAG